MYRTTLYNLSEDLEHASAAYGQRELGEINAEEMHSLLEFLRHIDPVELHDAQPYISVSTPLGRYNVRATAGKLHLYDLAHTEVGGCEFEPVPLIHQITPRFEKRKFNQETLDLSNARKRTNHVIAIAMLFVGLLLNAYTLYAAFYIDDIHRAPPLTLVVDLAEQQGIRDLLSGQFATGSSPGDREISVKPTGDLELSVVPGKGRPKQRMLRPYTPGRRDGKLFLAMRPHGQIEVISRDKLLLYGDTYYRVQP